MTTVGLPPRSTARDRSTYIGHTTQLGRRKAVPEVIRPLHWRSTNCTLRRLGCVRRLRDGRRRGMVNLRRRSRVLGLSWGRSRVLSGGCTVLLSHFYVDWICVDGSG